jgi:hypothetical protein
MQNHLIYLFHNTNHTKMSVLPNLKRFLQTFIQTKKQSLLNL